MASVRHLERARPCQIVPTVGTVSVLKTGVFTTLRLDDPQANQTLQCDPAVPQGQEFTVFQTGCTPWYGANTWADPWWIGTPDSTAPIPASGSATGAMPMGTNSLRELLAVRAHRAGHVHRSGR